MMTSVFTYIFWFFTAKVAGPQAIGVASYLSSLTMIITTLDVLDMSLGMKRSLGVSISHNDLDKFKEILTSTTIFVSIIVASTVFIIEIPTLHLLELLKIDKQYEPVFIAQIVASPFQIIFTEALIAALRAKDLQIPLILGALVRFPLLAISVYVFKTPIMGTVIAYPMLTFIVAILYGFFSFRIFRNTTGRVSHNFFSNVKHVLLAGLASWFPHVIYVLGAQLGLVTIVASSGASQGGKFYLALGIFLVMLFIVMGISRVIHSSISSISNNDEQAKLLSDYMRMAFMFTIPLAAPLLFFAKNFMSLMGQEYASASSALTIFMIGIPLSIISEMVYYFTYGKGDHKTVLYLGVTGNVPRILLYFILPPILEVDGAAIAYVTGSASQLILSIYILKGHLLKIEFKKFTLLTIIPVSIGFVVWTMQIHYIFSTIIIIFASALTYVRFHLFTDNELRNILYMILPSHRAEKIYPKLSKVMRRIN